jgi:Membrane bound beta barrel domain (DUF5777)
MRKLSFILFTAMSLAAASHKAQAQGGSDDLMKMLDQEEKNGKHKKEYVTATFKATRIVNGHSIENLGKGILDFRIMHRFGELSNGEASFWGFDQANTKLALDYGITDWLMVGAGRSAFKKEYDGFAKVKLLRQRSNGGMPISASFVTGFSLQGKNVALRPDGKEYEFVDRMHYFHQVLVARKFNDWLSLQVMPTIVHYNVVDSSKDPNDIISLGVGGRIKLTNRLALTGEYYYNLPGSKLDGYQNALSFGIDIETGGHVFQLVFTNADAINERSFIAQNKSQWSKGQVHFGFNISRVFTIVQPKEFKDSRNKIW